MMSIMSMMSVVSVIALLALASFSVVTASKASDPFNLDLADKYVHFSGAAYCAHPRFKKDQIDNWSCKACEAYPGVIATTFTSDRECNGYVGYYPTDNEIVVSFSGTDPFNIQMWIDDLDFIKTDYPLCDGCQVHEGFYKTYLSSVDQIRNLTASYLTQYPTASITCTGHSLGAALASLCAADLQDLYGDRADLVISSPYTFGLPRVGDEVYSTWFNSDALPFDPYRVVHRKDPVPQVPFQSMGFHHYAYEIFYIEDYSKYTVCSADGEDSDCSDKYVISVDVIDHLHYLGFDFTTNFLNCEL